VLLAVLFNDATALRYYEAYRKEILCLKNHDVRKYWERWTKRRRLDMG